MPTFRKDIHLGHEVPMIDSSDINDKVILGRHIMDRVIDWFHIKPKAIRNEHIDDGAVDARTLADGSVTTPKIADGAVTPEKLSDRVVPEVINPLLKPLKDKDADLQNQIDSLTIHGMAVSNEFGDDPHIGISQKALTEAFHNLYTILGDITGETYEGFSMLVSPTYYIGEDGCTVTINASTLTTVGKFERIAFYWNSEEEPFLERENVYGIDGYQTELPLDKMIDDQVIIRCEAKILGQNYTDQKAIRHYDSFWLGAGSTYQSVMIPANLIPAGHHMRGAYDVNVEQGNHIIIVVGEALASGFIRADMNGMEIAFTQSTVTIDGKNYKVFASEDTYQAGTYNIDING